MTTIVRCRSLCVASRRGAAHSRAGRHSFAEDQPAPVGAPPPAKTAPFPPQPPPADKPGFLHELKGWWDNSLGFFRQGTGKDPATSPRSAAGAAGNAVKGAVEATKNAATAIVKLPGTRMIDIYLRCENAPNGAPDCEAAAASACRAKGFGGGHPLDVRTEQKCDAATIASGSAAGATQLSGRDDRHPRHLSVISGEVLAAMMSKADRNKAADILMAAEKTRKQAVQISKTWPDITMDDAYAISTEVANRKIAAGAKLIGHKVGLTSKAMQRSSQIDEPDYGHLLDTMMIADGARVPHENFCLPRVEIELAFVLGKPLRGPGIGLTDVLRATEYVVPAIEVVDARLQDPRKIFDTVSDNGAAAGIVVGGRPVKPQEVDLRWVGGIMYRNSEIEETGVAAGVLGHPALGVAWLANKLGAHGVTIEPGHLVLAGSFTRVVFARKGDTLHADFGSLGGIALQFV